MEEPTIRHALPLRGNGRVPVPVGDDIALISYVNYTRTYDYRRVASDGTVVWEHSLPAGGYSSGLYVPELNRLCGPSDYTDFVELDWDSGVVTDRWPLGVRVRSTPIRVGGEYIVCCGNLLFILYPGGQLDYFRFPGYVFTGTPRYDGPRPRVDGTETMR